MPSNKIIHRQTLEVELNGQLTDTRACRFNLVTQKGFSSVFATLHFPTGSKDGKKGDSIKVYIADKESKDLYFTGTVYNATEIDNYRKLFLTDGYWKLCHTSFTASYRKEKASSIVSDVLDAAGVSEKSVTVPDVELARFSTKELSAHLVLDILLDALKEHGARDITYFFDEKDCFHFGTPKDTGKNTGKTFCFNTKETIFSHSADWIETLPSPIRHSMKVTVDGVSKEVIRTDLTVQEGVSRLILHVGGSCT